MVKRSEKGKNYLSPRAALVYNALLGDIESGKYPPFFRLPIEKDLCAQFGVSRTSVRRALQRLVDENIIKSQQGSGSFVLPPDKINTQTRIVSVMFQRPNELLVGLQDKMLKKGYLMSLYSQDRYKWTLENELIFLREVANQRHQALLANCIPDNSDISEALDQVSKAGVRVIHTEPFADDFSQESYCMPDYRHAGHMGAVNLMMNGCRELFFIDIVQDSPYTRLQRYGFFQALKEHLGYDPATLENHYLKVLRNNILDDQSQEKLDVILKTNPEKIGFLATSKHRAVFAEELSSKDRPKVFPEIDTIYTEVMGDTSITYDLGNAKAIRFDYSKIYEQAIELAVSPDFDEVKCLFPPQIVEYPDQG